MRRGGAEPLIPRVERELRDVAGAGGNAEPMKLADFGPKLQFDEGAEPDEQDGVKPKNFDLRSCALAIVTMNSSPESIGQRSRYRKRCRRGGNCSGRTRTCCQSKRPRIWLGGPMRGLNRLPGGCGNPWVWEEASGAGQIAEHRLRICDYAATVGCSACVQVSSQCSLFFAIFKDFGVVESPAGRLPRGG